MPQYEFECKKCKTVYAELTPYDDTGKYPKIKCPECGSKRKDKLLSVCNFQFAQPEGTSRWISDTHGHGYRFNHNLPKVIAERQAAEEASHMGADVYNPINDLENDANWGEVK